MKKRGRPTKENSKTVSVHVRLTEEEYDMLNYLCLENGMNKGEMFRNSLRRTYNITKSGLFEK